MSKKLPESSKVIECLRKDKDRYESHLYLKTVNNKAFILWFPFKGNQNSFLIQVNRKIHFQDQTAAERNEKGIREFFWHTGLYGKESYWGTVNSPSFLGSYVQIIDSLFQKFNELKSMIEKGNWNDYKEGFCESFILKQSPSLAATRGVIGTYDPSKGKPIRYYQMLVSPEPALGRYNRKDEAFIDHSILIFLINYFPKMFICGYEKPIIFCQKYGSVENRVRAIVFPPNWKDLCFY